ncbi:anti-CBASS protein Acb1 family protein [Lactobacillus sp. HT06-2]|uniref:anti-CBASS protein Acb1 family protein n=1 Tax=Lactobacillus sp. HT06-2 TaxID=2080222 RepID=UPI000CD937CD|nr:anti-CBASS Acb1 family protein [Lactobacillus sp. HT06-2]
MADKKKKMSVVRTDALNLGMRTPYRQAGWIIQSNEQDYEALDNQYKHDAITQTVVSKLGFDATRNGLRIVIPNDAKLQQAYQDAFDKRMVLPTLAQQTNYYNRHGDGYVAYGLLEDHPTSTDTPIDPFNIRDLAFIHAFGQTNIQAYKTNDDPTSADYGKESALVIRPKQPGQKVNKDGTITTEQAKLEPVVIDASRYSHIALDKSDGDETGTSLITRCENQLKNMQIATESVGKMLREYTFKVFQSDRLMTEDDDKFRRDKMELSQVANTEGMMFISSDDTLTKVSTQAGGVNVLIDYLWQDLSAACRIPKSVLTGEQAGTLAGADQDVVNYYDTVKAFQDQCLKPEVEKIVRLLMYSKDVAGGYLDPDSIDWHVEFNPLYTPDEKTQAETFQTTANALSTLVGAAIIGPDEAADRLNGQANNQVGQMQNTNNGDMEQDSAESWAKAHFTDEQIKQYEDDLKAAHNG